MARSGSTKICGLSYTEIWISEAQERMVMSVPQKSLERLKQVCASEGVEASVIGQFVPTGMLRLMYKDKEVGILSMHFLARWPSADRPQRGLQTASNHSRCAG